jgi:glycerate kinase
LSPSPNIVSTEIRLTGYWLILWHSLSLVFSLLNDQTKLGKMKFVLAPDKFKGSLTGFEICDAMETGIKRVFKDAVILKLPVADGGDGTLEVVRYYLKAKTIKLTVNDPLFRPVEASYLFSKDTKIAYIEMAEASGLKLLREDEKNCIATTSLGTGELLVDAIKMGAKEIILGIGGSATNDAGMGMASALGFAFLDENDQPLSPIGGNLIHVRKIDASAVDVRLKTVMVKVACDVTNPFYGHDGAAHVYAEQKGASKKEIEILDKGLQNLAKVLLETFGIDVQHMQGAGAAGGAGAGTAIFLNATLTSGIDLIKELADFDTQIKGADWILTGEGKLDGQTLSGKTINGVIRSAKKQDIPVAALCGAIDLSILEQEELGLDYAASIVQGVTSLDQALLSSQGNLVLATYNFANLLKRR